MSTTLADLMTMMMISKVRCHSLEVTANKPEIDSLTFLY